MKKDIKLNHQIVFQKYSQFYNILNSDKNYVEEVNYIDKLINKYSKSGSNILEFGSGTGIHGSLLGQRGYNVVGIEYSEDMVKNSISHDGFYCHVGDIRTKKIDKKFDVVIAIFHVISYMTENTDIESVFNNAYQHLNDFGIFIFDVWYSPCVYHLQPEIRIKKVENNTTEFLRIAEPIIHQKSNTVDVLYNFFFKEKNVQLWENFQERHCLRHFSTPEIEMFAKRSNFDLLHSEEFMSGQVPSLNTWGVCYILQKKM